MFNWYFSPWFLIQTRGTYFLLAYAAKSLVQILPLSFSDCNATQLPPPWSFWNITNMAQNAMPSTCWFSYIITQFRLGAIVSKQKKDRVRNRKAWTTAWDINLPALWSGSTISTLLGSVSTCINGTDRTGWDDHLKIYPQTKHQPQIASLVNFKI